MKVLWVKNDQPIEPTDRLHIESDRPKCPPSVDAIDDSRHWLEFEEVVPEDSGVYFCEAYNNHGEAYSYCRLKVVDPREAPACPPCIVGALTPLHITEGTRARFRATVRGHPTPALTWELDGQALVPSRRVQISVSEGAEGVQVFLSYLSAEPADSGTLSLTARNAAGRQTMHTTLQVIPVDTRSSSNTKPRTSAAKRSSSLERKPQFYSVVKSSSSKSLPSRSLSPSPRSRAPVKKYIPAVPSNLVISKNDKPISARAIISQSTSAKSTPSESLTSPDSSVQSSPRCRLQRSGSSRSPSPQLTFQFKSPSVTPLRNNIKSRSPSPIQGPHSCSNSLRSRDTTKPSVKHTARAFEGLSSAVHAGNASLPNTSQDSNILTGRPPTSRSRVTTSPSTRPGVNSLEIKSSTETKLQTTTGLKSPKSVINQTLNSVSPASRSPTSRSPTSRSPTSRSPASRSPASRSPTSRSPKSRSPASRSPTSRSPASRSPASRSPASRSPASRSPTSSSPEFESSSRSSSSPSPTNNSPTPPASRSSTSNSDTSRAKLPPYRSSVTDNILINNSKSKCPIYRSTRSEFIVFPTVSITSDIQLQSVESPSNKCHSVDSSLSFTFDSTNNKDPISNARENFPQSSLSSTASKPTKPVTIEASPRKNFITSQKVTPRSRTASPRISPVRTSSSTTSPRVTPARSTSRDSPGPPRIKPTIKEQLSQHGSMDSAYCSGRASAASVSEDVDTENRSKGSSGLPEVRNSHLESNRTTKSTSQVSTLRNKFEKAHLKPEKTRLSSPIPKTSRFTTMHKPQLAQKGNNDKNADVQKSLPAVKSVPYRTIAKPSSNFSLKQVEPKLQQDIDVRSRSTDTSTKSVDMLKDRLSKSITKPTPIKINTTQQYKTKSSLSKCSLENKETAENTNSERVTSSMKELKSPTQPPSNKFSTGYKKVSLSSHNSPEPCNKVLQFPKLPSAVSTSLDSSPVNDPLQSKTNSPQSTVSGNKPVLETNDRNCTSTATTSTVPSEADPTNATNAAAGPTQGKPPENAHEYNPNTASLNPSPPPTQTSSSVSTNDFTLTSAIAHTLVLIPTLSLTSNKTSSPTSNQTTSPTTNPTSRPTTDTAQSLTPSPVPEVDISTVTSVNEAIDVNDKVELNLVNSLSYNTLTKETEKPVVTNDFAQPKEVESDLDIECEFFESEDEEEGAQIICGPQDLSVTRGQSATLTFSFSGNPPPEVTWKKKDTVLGSGPRHTVRVGRGVSSLTIHDVTANDSAKYTAVVRNCISAHAGFASLSVEDVPEPPSAQPNLSEVGAGSVTLSWYGPAYDGGSVVTGYTVETRKVGQVDWTALVDRWHSTSFKVTGQEVGGQYEYRVKAHNVHGLSEPCKSSQPITLQGNGNSSNGAHNNGINGDESEADDEDETVDFEHSCVDFQPAEVFSQHYDIHEEVGKGRFGIVYRCTDKRTGRKRAAKIVKCIKSKEKEKVREEMSIMNALRHPKLLQLAAAFERSRDVVMIMEFIAGGELFERVVADDFTLTEKDVILFMRQICEGVQYMHNNNILHLDLKPENILCVRKTTHKIKLIDFGLARRFNPAEPCRVLFGTPEFIAPEIINYEPISYSSDMWSVGVICYVLLSGLSPFMGDNDAETFANITRAEFDFDDDAFNAISEGAKGFITALLVNRKEDRLTSGQCLQHPWLTQTEGTMNKRVLPTDKLKKFIIRRKWQKTGNAIRALGRMTSLSNRRNSQPSSPTRLSPLPEQQQQQQSCPPKRGCPSTRTSNSIVSERSDSGISECSLTVDEMLHNTTNTLRSTAAALLTSTTAPTGPLSPTKEPKGVDWQSSVDSAVGDDFDAAKGEMGRKISQDALLKSSPDCTSFASHSRV